MGSLINKDFEIASSSLSKKQQRAAKRRQKKTDLDQQDGGDVPGQQGVGDAPENQDVGDTLNKQDERAMQVEQDKYHVQSKQDHDAQAKQTEFAAEPAVEPAAALVAKTVAPTKKDVGEAQDKQEKQAASEPNNSTRSLRTGSPGLRSSIIDKRYLSKLSSPPVHPKRLHITREFPSLSNNAQLPSTSQSSLWSSAGNRTMPPIQRNQGTPLSQQGQEDIFSSSSRGSFRFGGSQGSVGQPTQPQPSSIDDFPPLNNNNSSGFRNGNGDIGQERGSNLMSTLGFGATTSPAPGMQGNRAGNGLLNALSENSRSGQVRSPDVSSAPGSGRPQDSRGAIGEEQRQKPPGFRDDSLASQSSSQEAAAQPSECRNPLGAIGNDVPMGTKVKDDKDTQSSSVNDPLAGMAAIDKWGIKGLRTLMNNYPDYQAAITGIDPQQFGLNLQSTEPITTQMVSVVNDTPPRPVIPSFRLPECYSVSNVQPLDNKISSFNEETLMWIFYSCPGDVKQHQAANELNNRNWRWHKKHQLWLTKDEIMTPRLLSHQHEQGYYIIWDTTTWQKTRRELVLYYADLDTTNGAASA